MKGASIEQMQPATYRCTLSSGEFVGVTKSQVAHEWGAAINARLECGANRPE
jgi:hypothetical protein